MTYKRSEKGIDIIMRKGSFWLQSDKLIIKSSAKIFSQEEHSYEESELEQTENKEESIEKSNIEEIKPQTFENEEQVSECKNLEPKQQTSEPKYGQTFRETLKNLNFSEQTIYQTNEMFNNKYQQNSEKGKNIQQNNENRRNSQQNTCNSFHVSLYRKISNDETGWYVILDDIDSKEINTSPIAKNVIKEIEEEMTKLENIGFDDMVKGSIAYKKNKDSKNNK